MNTLNIKRFDISRLHTPQGIFKLTGYIELSNQQITYTKAEFMGSDGWCELDLHSEHALKALDTIRQAVYAHCT